MKTRPCLLTAFLLAGLTQPAVGSAAAGNLAAFEISSSNTERLPGGKEADGIIGDFVLRNDRVVAVVSGNLPLRRANMGTYYGGKPDSWTPGCLYDLTLAGEDNDQLTIFAPSNQRGPVSYVRVLADGSAGEAIVETVVTAAANNGLSKRHEYRLGKDWQGLLIVTTFRNESDLVKTGSPGDRWNRFGKTGQVQGISWADSVDPVDRAGYAYRWEDSAEFKAPPNDLKIKPGEEVTFARFIAVGQSPAEAVGILAGRRAKTGRVHGRVLDGRGAVRSARLDLTLDNKVVPGYVNDDGRFDFQWPIGQVRLAVKDQGRHDLTRTWELKDGETEALNLELSPASQVVIDIEDAQGRPIPCKAQFIGIQGTKSPSLGPNNRAHGCRDQYHSESGRFQVQVPPGHYRVIVTRGVEYSHLAREIQVEAEKAVTIKGTLKRIVDTTGWISADFHNHSTPSGDNTCGTDDRIINLAAEHIEFAPTTEHNRLYDWQPHIDRLGLSRDVATVIGIELTGSGAHFNSFPFKVEPFRQDNGAPVWHSDPRVSALLLTEYQGQEPDRWLQVNHPDMVWNFADRNRDGKADGGFVGLGRYLDGVEILNGRTSQILSRNPFYLRKNKGKETVYHASEFIWLQLLNQGARYWSIAVSDAHTVHGNGVGGWRMFFPSSTDDPEKIDWREIAREAKAGRSIVTTGPFLRVTTADGTMPGGSTRSTGKLKLKVQVQCTDWLAIDRVQVLVNGRQEPSLNFTRKSHPKMFRSDVVQFDQELTCALTEDSHLIVVAMGENSDLSIGYGSSDQAPWRPCAYNNPIFVDVDGGGFQPNGDNLGWPLPAAKPSVQDYKKLASQP